MAPFGFCDAKLGSFFDMCKCLMIFLQFLEEFVVSMVEVCGFFRNFARLLRLKLNLYGQTYSEF